MSTPSYDPVELLASLLKGGSPQADAPAPPFVEWTRQMLEMQQDFLKQVGTFWTGAFSALGAAPDGTPEGAKPPPDDRRFAAEAWRNDPRFDLVRRSYLAYADLMQRSVDSVPLDPTTKSQMRFGMKQFVDSISPSNFFLTNPEAMQLAAETGGQSVVEGINLFLEDLSKGRVSSTDETAYVVGESVATTPGSVIFENELMQLIQYAPTTADVFRRPLLMVPPCINKFYVLDLQPDNSLVRHAVAAGHTVLMISWRNVDATQGTLTWDDYLRDGVLKGIEVALDISQADRINVLGFCVGGTLLASALGVLRGQARDPVASMTLLTTMLDFSDTGELGALVTRESVAAREAAIGHGGVMQGKELGFAFSSLRANDLIWQYVVNSYLKGKAPPAFDMLYWNADSTNLPGPMFCWYIRNTYLENNLRVPGKTVQCNEPVDLSLVDMPVFLYASRDDHIVPWRTAYASTEVLGGPATFVLGASGHIAGVINPPAKNKRNYWTGGTLDPDPERWFATAQSVPGSWWPAWSNWLAEHAGERVGAPATPGNERHHAIEPAPGRYVRQKDA